MTITEMVQRANAISRDHGFEHYAFGDTKGALEKLALVTEELGRICRRARRYHHSGRRPRRYDRDRP